MTDLQALLKPEPKAEILEMFNSSLMQPDQHTKL